MDYENRLSGIRLALHKSFVEYLLECGKNSNFVYDLDQFNHELRTYSLRKNDADVVNYFFKNMLEALGGQKIVITPPRGEIPAAHLAGKNFPNISLHLDLAFMVYPHSLICDPLQVISHNTYIDAEKYTHSILYEAWQQLIRKLPEEHTDGIKLKAAFKSSIVKKHEENGGDYFRAEVSIKNDSFHRAPNITLDEIVARAQTVCEAVQQSYVATKNLPIEYERSKADIQQRLLAP